MFKQSPQSVTIIWIISVEVIALSLNLCLIKPFYNTSYQGVVTTPPGELENETPRYIWYHIIAGVSSFHTCQNNYHLLVIWFFLVYKYIV